jgi:hypothetical protein
MVTSLRGIFISIPKRGKRREDYAPTVREASGKLLALEGTNLQHNKSIEDIYSEDDRWVESEAITSQA